MNDRITFTINTKDRVEYLLITLSSLLSQTFQEWDLIISDASDDPVINREQVSRLLGIIKRYGHKVMYLRDSGSGIPQTYQKMMGTADTELIVRQEDDIWLEPECLQLLYDTIKEDDNCAAVGWMTPRFSQVGCRPTAPDRLANGFVMRPSHLAPNLGLIHEAVDEQQSIIYEDKTFEVCTIHGGSLYRKSFAEKVGGFCTHYSPVGHREETMFYLRLYFAGYNLKVRTSIKLWHFESTYGGSRSKGALSDERVSMQRSDEDRFQRELREMISQHPDRQIDIFTEPPVNY